MDRQAEARARYAGMETGVLERMWIREERVEWAEAALRDELIARGCDPDSLATQRIVPEVSAPAWADTAAGVAAEMAAAARTSSPAGRPVDDMPVQLFAAAVACLFVWSAGLYWYAFYDPDGPALGYRVVVPLLVLLVGGGSLHRPRRIAFRYVYVASWAVCLVIATGIVLHLPRHEPRESLFAEVNTPAGTTSARAVAHQDERVAATIIGTWRRTSQQLADQMDVYARDVRINDARLFDAGQRSRTHSAINGWRADLLERSLANERARRELLAAEVPIIAAGRPLPAAFPGGIAELDDDRRVMAQTDDGAAASLAACEAVVDFFDGHADGKGVVDATIASNPDYRSLDAARTAAWARERAAWAVIAAQRAKAATPPR